MNLETRYRRFGAALYRHALALCGSADDAEDALQAAHRIESLVGADFEARTGRPYESREPRPEPARWVRPEEWAMIMASRERRS